MGEPFIFMGRAPALALVLAALPGWGLDAREPAPADANQVQPSGAKALVTEIPPERVLRRRPRFLSVAPRQAREGETYQYGFAAVDPEGEALRYVLVRAPKGAQLDRQMLRWTPGRSRVGQRERFVLRAVDEDGRSVTQAWTVLTREPGHSSPN
jgi:hypothetical protein